MKLKSKFIVSLIFIFLPNLLGINVIYYFITSFFYDYDSILEYKINKTFKKVQKTNDFHPIAFQNFTDKKVIKACIQTPYEPQFSFEKRLGTKVFRYVETNDEDMYVLWLFFSNGLVAKIRPYQMNPGKYHLICREQVSTIVFKQENNTIKFLISGE